jgi:GT2 family glycosyltransferase
MHDRVTFGITAFQRPGHLERLVASILKRYPLAKILVADNGNRKARLPDSVRVMDLEFDCGLSRARNALFDNFETEYLLILEEDFLFTHETNIEQFVEVLDTDDQVGVVGGSIRGINGRLAAYSLDIEVFRDTMYVREASHRVKITPSGVPYRLVRPDLELRSFSARNDNATSLARRAESRRTRPLLSPGKNGWILEGRLQPECRLVSCP